MYTPEHAQGDTRTLEMGSVLSGCLQPGAGPHGAQGSLEMRQQRDSRHYRPLTLELQKIKESEIEKAPNH